MCVEILLESCMGVTKRQWAATMRASYTMDELGRKGKERLCQRVSVDRHQGSVEPCRYAGTSLQGAT
jgi:hypothetical protein